MRGTHVRTALCARPERSTERWGYARGPRVSPQSPFTAARNRRDAAPVRSLLRSFLFTHWTHRPSDRSIVVCRQRCVPGLLQELFGGRRSNRSYRPRRKARGACPRTAVPYPQDLTYLTTRLGPVLPIGLVRVFLGE